MANKEKHKQIVILDSSELGGDFSSYFLSNTFSDLQFVIEDQKVPAHKIVISTRCLYFKSLLSSSPNLIEFILLPNVSLEIFKNVLRYLYTGTIIMYSDGNLILDLIKVAHEYCLQHLEDTLSKKITEFLDKDNVCMVLNKANLYDMNEVKNVCHNFIDKHISYFKECDAFMELTQISMVNFLRRDSLLLPETDIFEIAQKWVKVNKDDGNLVIKCIRLSCFTKKEILNIVRPSGLIDNETILNLLTQFENDKLQTPQYRTGLKLPQSLNVRLVQDIHLALQLLEKQSHFLFKASLDSDIIKKAKFVLSLQNVCSLLNVADLYELDKLRNICHKFMDVHALEIISRDLLSSLTQKSMIRLLERDSFVAPEVDIFKSVAKWYSVNTNSDDSVIKCVRFSSMSLIEIVTIVWPSKLVDYDNLWQIISAIAGVKSRNFRTPINENIVNSKHKAVVVTGNYNNWDSANVTTFACHKIDGQSNIVIKLGRLFYINSIQMMLYNKDTRFYSYYIEVSIDKKKWQKIVDYSQYHCRARQTLYFETQLAQYIKIVGTRNSKGENFELISVEAYLKKTIPKIDNGIFCPENNVVTPEECITYVEKQGVSTHIGYDSKIWNGYPPITHIVNNEHLILHLSQPFMIASIKLSLYSDYFSYTYLIETSLNKTDWQIAVDCKNWFSYVKQHDFDARPATYIRITGKNSTYTTCNGRKAFACNSIECPSVNHV